MDAISLDMIPQVQKVVGKKGKNIGSCNNSHFNH